MVYGRNILFAVAAVSLAGAAVAKPSPPPPPPPNGTLIGGCDNSLPSPDASACAGYYTGNILNGSPTDIVNQENAIASLPGTYTWDGDWTALSTGGDVITSLTNGNELDFGQTLYGQTVIAAHFGNIQDNTGHSGNVSVFWLFDFGTAGADYVTLDHTRGFSNAALYTTGSPPGVPEPATWGMMLIGFAAAGAGIRRRRSKNRHAHQLA